MKTKITLQFLPNDVKQFVRFAVKNSEVEVNLKRITSHSTDFFAVIVYLKTGQEAFEVGAKWSYFMNVSDKKLDAIQEFVALNKIDDMMSSGEVNVNM